MKTLRLNRFWGVALALFLAQGALAQGVSWPLWSAYSSAFIDNQGRVIDPQGSNRTTSEGQAYAMFFALAANDRGCFDRLLHWTQNNLAAGDLKARLPGWEWGRDAAGRWHLLDANPASDADLWISYTLLEAGRLWTNSYYSELGHSLARRIAQEEVGEIPAFGTMLLPGAKGFHPDAATWYVNPSYVPLMLLVRMGQLDSTGPWRRIASAVPRLMQQSSREGFAMDWVSYRTQSGFSPASLPGTNLPHEGSYDAIRVYLWAGMADIEMAGRDIVLAALSGMAKYLLQNAVPPEKINEFGVPKSGAGPVGFSAALLPYLKGLNQLRAYEQQRHRIESLRDAKTNLFGPQRAYYDQNLALFGLGSIERRFRFGRNGELIVAWKNK